MLFYERPSARRPGDDKDPESDDDDDDEESESGDDEDPEFSDDDSESDGSDPDFSDDDPDDDRPGDSDDEPDDAGKAPQEDWRKNASFGDKNPWGSRVKTQAATGAAGPGAADVLGRLKSDAHADEIFCIAIKEECAQGLEDARRLKRQVGSKPGCYVCPFCPYKEFMYAAALCNHMDKQHVAKAPEHPIRNFGRCTRGVFDDMSSDTICAPWALSTGDTKRARKKENDAGEKAEQPMRKDYMKRTAALVREWNKGVARPILGKTRLGCRREDFKILIGRGGGRLLLVTHPDHGTDHARRLTSHLSVTEGFLQRAAAIALVTDCRPAAVADRLAAEAAAGSMASGLSALVPGRDPVSDMLERIYMGPTADGMLIAMKDTLGAETNEYVDLGIDCSVKVAQACVGHTPEGVGGKRFEDEETKVVQVQGQTGMVLHLDLVIQETAEVLIEMLKSAVPAEYRSETKHICCDHPPTLIAMLTELRQAFPGLEVLSGDLIHIAKIRLERHTDEKPSQLSTLPAQEKTIASLPYKCNATCVRRFSIGSGWQ